MVARKYSLFYQRIFFHINSIYEYKFRNHNCARPHHYCNSYCVIEQECINPIQPHSTRGVATYFSVLSLLTTWSPFTSVVHIFIWIHYLCCKLSNIKKFRNSIVTPVLYCTGSTFVGHLNLELSVREIFPMVTPI